MNFFPTYRSLINNSNIKLVQFHDQKKQQKCFKDIGLSSNHSQLASLYTMKGADMSN